MMVKIAVQRSELTRPPRFPRCRVPKDTRWHDGYRPQYDWCLRADPNQVA